MLWALGVGVLLVLVSLPIVLMTGPRVGRWIALSGFWAMCAMLVAAGIGSFAKAILDATDDNASRSRRLLIPMLHVVFGTIYLFGGSGGFWAFTVAALYGVAK